MSLYLVTGGAGFIGSNIVTELLKRGENVRVLDNLATGKKENIRPHLDKIDFINGSCTDQQIVESAMKDVDYVLHHAAIPSVPRSVEDPFLTNKVNIDGTLTLLEAARNKKVKRFVYAASSSAYGDSPTMPKIETMVPSPKSPYATQKLTGEYYCQNFHQLYGLETVCLRYFNVFGPRQDPQSTYSAVIPLFITKMLRGEAPTIYGSPDISRDFTYVANNVAANIKACTSSQKVAGEIINIATGKETSLGELVKKINMILGTSIEPNYAPGRTGDVAHSLGDTAKAQELLGHKTVVDFESGLEKTIEFYQNTSFS